MIAWTGIGLGIIALAALVFTMTGGGKRHPAWHMAAPLIFVGGLAGAILCLIASLIWE